MTTITRAGVVLGGCVLVAIALLKATDELTTERIEHAQHALRLRQLIEILPEGPFDSDPLQSLSFITAAALGSDQPQPVYTVYRDSKPLAAVLTVTAPDGYSGNIRLLLGVDYDGVIIGLRTTEHNETPGLGDDIELRRSDWILSFNGRSLHSTTAGDWQVRKRGGQFDAFTGATVTPSAVVNAVHRALQWYQQNRNRIFMT